MAILGFVFGLIALGYLSVPVAALALYGGFEMGPLNIKQYWWYAPLVGVIILLWYTLITNAPFTVALST